MATSQFTYYSSYDSGSTPITGLTGSLITVLDSILITGYSNKRPAGWTKVLTSGSVFAGYQPASGSKLYLYINDIGGSGSITQTGQQAWACGWESLIGTGMPIGGNMTGSVGSGSGQFPLPAQSLTNGHVIIRKSASATPVARQWQAFVDASTMYLFIQTGDSTTRYYVFMFGDVFSLKSTDPYKCMIRGSNTENTSTTNNGDTIGVITNAGQAGSFMARTFGGGGFSILINSLGNYSLADGSPAAGAGQIVMGSQTVQNPNGTDNMLYMSPLWVAEAPAVGNGQLRGRYRGMYHLCTPITNYFDGQIFQGTGDLVNKTFQIVSAGPNAGQWAIEISNTVETN